MNLARNLKRIRKQKRISQRGLAAKTGLSDAYVNQLETKAKGNPSMLVIGRIADALGVTISDLTK